MLFTNLIHYLMLMYDGDPITAVAGAWSWCCQLNLPYASWRLMISAFSCIL